MKITRTIDGRRQSCAGPSDDHHPGRFGHTTTTYTTVTYDDGRRFHYCPDAWDTAAPGVIAAMREADGRA